MSEIKDFIQGGGTLAPQIDANTEAIKAKAGYNFILNGTCEVNLSDSNSFSNITTTSHTFDGWAVGTSGTAINISRSDSTDWPTTPPVGVRRNLVHTFPTALTSVTSGSYIYINQCIEGFEARFLIDTEITLSFWVRVSVAGTYTAALQDEARTNAYVMPFTVASNTWEFKTFTIPGGVPSSFIPSDGGISALRLRFCPVAGTTFQTATPLKWVSGNYFAITGQSNAASTAGATFSIAGVKLELGNEPTNYNSNYWEEETRCLRRFQKYYNLVGHSTFANGSTANNCFGYMNIALPVMMRATPSISYSAGGQVNKINHGGSIQSITQGGFGTEGARTLWLDCIIPSPCNNWIRADVVLDARLI